MHRLTRQVVVSSPAKVRVNGKLVTRPRQCGKNFIAYTYLVRKLYVYNVHTDKCKWKAEMFRSHVVTESWYAVAKLIFRTLMAHAEFAQNEA